jgi:phage gp36-like protein
VSQYATALQVRQTGLPSTALTTVSDEIILEHVVKASGKIDTFLPSQYTLPLSAPYPDSIVDAAVVISTYTLLVRYRGFRPDEYDNSFRLQYEDTMSWLDKLSRGAVSLGDDADADAALEGAPRVQTGGANRLYGTGDSGASRGW